MSHALGAGLETHGTAGVETGVTGAGFASGAVQLKRIGMAGPSTSGFVTSVSPLT